MKTFVQCFMLVCLIFTLGAVEERNPLPFYYLNAKSIKIKLNPKVTHLCRVKLNDIIHYKNIEIEECYDIGKKLSDTIKLIHEKNLQKNELNLMFLDENKKILNPELQTPEIIYTVKSILYFKKTKSHQIELMDQNGGYYYFIYNPLQVGIGE